MIKPTIGRKVWFFEAPGEKERDATIVNVWDDRTVNLFVVNHNGTASGRPSIALVQEGDTLPQGPHCTWMPFQVGQAKAAS